ncbi:MAG: GIY-YIG nuclease family protein [Chloroflexi bacterium]|nr:GIY-YIG nuclease family protein [Chloroflexota bacterium]
MKDLLNTVRQSIVASLPEFLLTEQRCPPEWQPFDLYLFRDDTVVFYVGQSWVAFNRVWRHILDGYKGRSVVGRFILCNWPAALRFTVELMDSRAERFAAVGHDLNAAERLLIEQHAPCFNDTLNHHPTSLPTRYAPPGQAITCPRSLGKLIREAEYAVKAERRKAWLA